MGFLKQEYWSGFPFPSPRESSQPRDWTQVSCIAGGFFTAEPARMALRLNGEDCSPILWVAHRCLFTVIKLPVCRWKVWIFFSLKYFPFGNFLLFLLYFKNCTSILLGIGFPGGAGGKEPACQCKKCRRPGFYPWAWKIPWRRAWQPLQYGWCATVHRVAKSQTWLKQLSTHALTLRYLVLFFFFLRWNSHTINTMKSMIQRHFVYSQCCATITSLNFVDLFKKLTCGFIDFTDSITFLHSISFIFALIFIISFYSAGFGFSLFFR